MTRTVTAAAQTALAADQVRLAVFVELDLPSGAVRVCNSGQSLAWNGYTWIGGAEFTSLQPVEESAQPAAAALALTFSGIDAALLSAVLADQYQGRAANIWVAPLQDNDVPVADPVLVFSGRIDGSEVSLGQSCSITYSLENRWARWNEARVRRLNSADQALRYPSDKGLDYVEAMETAELSWGIYKGPPAPELTPVQKTIRSVERAVSSVGNFVGDIFGW